MMKSKLLYKVQGVSFPLFFCGENSGLLGFFGSVHEYAEQYHNGR